ncbi:MAG: hypothetical protein EOP13_25720 [Pseudomonas sp.]|uniref:hypothetical protein n=1 Tax=Pseudomonas sp. TaxID=306 RepID=UPI0011F8DE0A|nr:hypothetical protein [Pseudomonas sp.]RZI68297.1 MAG: hypothetical protein EOP13_25720 [Pseudomonas sp.]
MNGELSSAAMRTIPACHASIVMLEHFPMDRRVRLTTIEHDGHRLRELTIIGDVPDYLPKSAVIRVAMDGRIEAGPVREHYAVQDNGEEQFKLLFENEHRRRMH